MPLVTCPDCSKKISDAAPACPGCGRPMDGISINARESLAGGPHRGKRSGSRLFWLLLIGAVVWFFWKTDKPASIPIAQVPIKQEQVLPSSQIPRDKPTYSDEQRITTQEYADSKLGWQGNSNDMRFDASRSSKGVSTCSIYISPIGKNREQNLVIQKFGNENFLRIKLFKSSWNMPKASGIPIVIEFSDNAPLNLQAFGIGEFLEVEIPWEATSSFLAKVRELPYIKVSFPRGSESPWRVDLDGIHPRLLDLNTCAMRQRLKDSASQPL